MDRPCFIKQANESARTSARFGRASRQIAQYKRRRVESFVDVGDADVYADSEHGAATSRRIHCSISGNQGRAGTQKKSENENRAALIPLLPVCEREKLISTASTSTFPNRDERMAPTSHHSSTRAPQRNVSRTLNSTYQKLLADVCHRTIPIAISGATADDECRCRIHAENISIFPCGRSK